MTRLSTALALVLASGCLVDGADGYAGFYESCTRTTECAGSADACFTVDWTEGVGGMCSAYCEVHTDCPGASSCWELIGDPAATRICYERCTDDFDCAYGFTCVDAVMGTSLADRICLPA